MRGEYMEIASVIISVCALFVSIFAVLRNEIWQKRNPLTIKPGDSYILTILAEKVTLIMSFK